MGMAVDSTDVDDASPSHAPSFPRMVGWSHAAIAVNSVLQLSTPLLLRFDFESHGPLTIDFRYHAFTWSTSLDEFPVDAVQVGLATAPLDPQGPPVLDESAQNLDGLLWLMGINSFDGAPAFWLVPGGRYKLTRWPNLTQHSHTMRQMHMMAMLGNTYADASELAAQAGVEEQEAQRLINALTLMRILSHSAEIAAPVVAEEPAAEKRQSLFSRLRARLGR
jgi:hypothetical protein